MIEVSTPGKLHGIHVEYDEVEDKTTITICHNDSHHFRYIGEQLHKCAVWREFHDMTRNLKFDEAA